MATLTKTGHGLLVRHEVGGVYPFDIADWVFSNDIDSRFINAAGELQYRTDGDSSDKGQYFFYHQDVPSRSDAFVQIVLRVSDDPFITEGPALQIDNAGAITAGAKSMYLNLGEGNDSVFMVELGYPESFSSSRPIDVNTDYRLTIAVEDGVARGSVTPVSAVGGWRETSPEAAMNTDDAGRVGIMFRSQYQTVHRFMSYFYACTRRHLNVEGLRPGDLVTVKDAEGVTLSSAAAAANGIARVDMVEVNLPDCVTVEAGGTSITPEDGVWPGDTYYVTGLISPIFWHEEERAGASLAVPAPGDLGPAFPVPSDLDFRPRVRYNGGAVILNLSQPMYDWGPGKEGLGSGIRFPSGAREAYVINRFHLLRTTLRFTEAEWPDVSAFIEFVQENAEAFTFWPSQAALDTSYLVYLAEPAVGSKWFPSRGQTPGMYELRIVLESADDTLFDLRQW